MRCYSLLVGLLAALAGLPLAADPPRPAAAATQRSATNIPVLVGIRDFFEKTANADGSFRPGVEPSYKGMADTAYSDLAAAAYAVILHKTFGWRLPHEAKTRHFLLSRQGKDGAFFNVAGTVDPKSPAGRLYNTTQGVVALHALGTGPKYDPRPALAGVLAADYKSLPPYTTSFFPLAYLAAGGPYPKEANRKVRSLLVQADDGYMLNHVAATFHLVHYYRLLGEKTPKADVILRRVLRDQRPDGSWMLNPLARDRHADFDAVFMLRQLGGDRADCQKAIARAAAWALTCRNPDGGFGHYPGSTSDADAVYFHVGTLVMAGVLKPAEPLPRDPQLLGWGHLLPRP
jgi:geranylgeranyl transferase type-2 subunit beta